MDGSPQPTSRKRSRLILAALIFVLGGAAGFLGWQHWSIYHLATVQEGVLYRDGARSAGELERAVEKVHAKTVVSLIDDKEMADPAKPQFKQEMAWLKDHGLKSERIPVRLGGWPNTNDVQRFLEIVQDPANQPVLVHCAQGVRRTAMMVAAYQESVLGYDAARAKSSILTFGHSDHTINDIRRFIDHYDPKSRTISPDLATARAADEK